LYWRNPYLKSGAEDLAHLLLLWCVFLPMNRYWSVDSALDPQSPDRPYPALPFIAIRLQIASLYLFAAFFKLAGAPWRSGDAVIWALGDTAFGATPIGLFLVHHVPMLLRVVNYLVIAFQLAFPFLMYSPWHNTWTRSFGLAGAALMHLSFMLCLNMGGFPFLSLILLVLLVPDVWIDRLLRRGRTQVERITIYYDPDCGFCRRVSLIIREFLLTRAARVLPASDEPEASRLLQQYQSWVVRTANGDIVLKWAALAYLLKQNFIFAPLGWLSDVSFLRRPMERLYDLIGAHRKQLGWLAKHLMPEREHGPIGVAALALCGWLSALAFSNNVSNLIGIFVNSGTAVSRLSAVFQVNQNWALFAPVPTHQFWNFTIFVIEQDGTMADLTQVFHPPLIATSSGKVSAASRAWMKYFTRFRAFDAGDWAALGRYLCEKAQRSIGPSPAVAGINVKVEVSPLSATSDSRKHGHEQRFRCVEDAS
jgi:Vitamin K-dependent gamma-carboxylase